MGAVQWVCLELWRLTDGCGDLSTLLDQNMNVPFHRYRPAVLIDCKKVVTSCDGNFPGDGIW